MMKYETPKLEVMVMDFSSEDVITTSQVVDGITNLPSTNEYEFKGPNN